MTKLRCFGQTAVIDDDGNERSLRSRKHLGLLVYLLAHPRTTHPREDLADLLWNDSNARARHSLSQALYDIRSNVGDLVEVTSTSVRMKGGCVMYEAEAFEKAVESGDHDTALDIYQGDFAPDLSGLNVETFDRWLDAEREGFRVLASIALRHAQRRAEERGDWDRMCLASLHLVRLNDFDEEAHCALMRGLWMKGDPASALRHYRTLSEELTHGWSKVRDLVDRLDNSGSVREVLTVPRPPIELVGRGDSFQRLLRFATNWSERGGIAVVTGEAGVGKTALIQEFSRLISIHGGAIDRSGPRLDESTGTGESTQGQTQLRLLLLSERGPDVVDWGALRRTPGCLILVETRDRRHVDHQLCDVVVPLSRLPQSDMVRLLIKEMREGAADTSTPSLLKTMAFLSGGNPQLALEMVHTVFATNAVGTLADAESSAVGRFLLGHSPRLAQLVETTLHGFTEKERTLAAELAVLSPESRLCLARESLQDDMCSLIPELEIEGWLSREENGIELSHPITELAIRTQMPIAVCKRIREQAATVLRSGSPLAQYLAARELSAAGIDGGAFAETMRLADEAGRSGDSVLASRASALALSRAETVEDRFHSALILARSELGRGRPSAAEAAIRSAGGFATTDRARLEAQLILLRSQIEVENREGTLVEAEKACELAHGLEDRGLTAITMLSAAEARLTASIGAQEGAAVEGLAARLESELHAAREVASVWPELWQASFRTLFLFRMISTSRSSAESLLQRFAHTLYQTNHPHARHVADLGRAVVEIRAGRLGTALPMLEALENTAKRNDRSRAVTLNNLGVLLTDLGQFSAARTVLKEVGSLDVELQPAEAEQVSTLLNHAQTAWFMSDHRAVRDLAGQALGRASAHDEQHLEAEALAILGLSAAELDETDTVYELGERLSEIDPPFLVSKTGT